MSQNSSQTLALEVPILCDWLKNDILGLAGPDYHSRSQLWDFIVAEFKQREALCLHRIRPFRTAKRKPKETVTGFCCCS